MKPFKSLLRFLLSLEFFADSEADMEERDEWRRPALKVFYPMRGSFGLTSFLILGVLSLSTLLISATFSVMACSEPASMFLRFYSLSIISSSWFFASSLVVILKTPMFYAEMFWADVLWLWLFMVSETRETLLGVGFLSTGYVVTGVGKIRARPLE